MYARLFLRFIAVIYLIAFWGLGTQILGLVGNHGILPVKDFLNSALQHWGRQHFWQVPTLCWFNSSDQFLLFLCIAGCICSVLLFFGILPWLNAFLLWIFYLSLMVAGQDIFITIGWDYCLLEAGFLAIFLLPVRFAWRWSKDEGPSKIVIWLFRLLLFKLMFESGLTKILGGDPTWANLTALSYHYLTQPLPNVISWYLYQLPMWFHKLSCILVFVVELLVPFLIFCGRRARRVAFWMLSGFQLLIMLTGSYYFFNLLTIALCFLLLDDNQLPLKHPPLWHTVITSILAVGVLIVSATQMIGIGFVSKIRFGIDPNTKNDIWKKVSPPMGSFNPDTDLKEEAIKGYFDKIWAILQQAQKFGYTICRFERPWRNINIYTPFKDINIHRNEIIIEGSQNASTWQEYEFLQEPQDVRKPPGWVMPFQPVFFDWLVRWYAARGNYNQVPWLINMMARILQGSRTVLDLFKSNPFKDKPPRYIRAIVYEYSFTNFVTKKKTKAWWQRKFIGPYTPVLSLNTQGSLLFH